MKSSLDYGNLSEVASQQPSRSEEILHAVFLSATGVDHDRRGLEADGGPTD